MKNCRLSYGLMRRITVFFLIFVMLVPSLGNIGPVYGQSLISGYNVTVYEAEDASVFGGAQVLGSKYCSGEKFVGYMGNGGGVTFNNINVAAEGDYKLTLFQIEGAGANRTIRVQVNSDAKMILNAPDSNYNWDSPGMMWLPVHLKAGNNTIAVDNSLNVWGPSLDRISVAPLERQTFYEAEDAALSNGATAVDNANASGGQYVSSLGTVTFTVNVNLNGVYNLYTYFNAPNQGELKIKVNGTYPARAKSEEDSTIVDNSTVSCNAAGNADARDFDKREQIPLNGGSNTIEITGNVNLDRIGIELMQEKNLTFSGETAAPSNPLSLWYRQPAQRWGEALPLGNGRLGGMIFGGVYTDSVGLNEVTTWSGENHAGKGLDNPNGPAALAALQAEMLKPNPDRAKVSQLYAATGGQGNSRFGSNRPFGRLNILMDGNDNNISNYRRSLDLETSMAYVDYDSQGISYQREAFVSNPDQVMVMKYTSSGSGKISFTATLDPENKTGGTGIMDVDDNCLVYNGTVFDGGVNTHACLKAVNTGGTVTYGKDGMRIEGADEVILILALGTTFNSNDPVSICKTQVNAAVQKTYEQLRDAHINDVQPLFNRSSIDIGTPEQDKSNLPTDVRVENIRSGDESDQSFYALWYQYARYLMIAGSRPNSPLPMNLQGIWNDNLACNMAWTCDYHLDINIEMNQWFTGAANLSEGELPIFKYLEDWAIPSGTIFASTQFGTGGWTAAVMGNAWGYNGSNAGAEGYSAFTGGGAWLAQEVMNYFDHTWDKDFLSTRGYPILKKTAQFYLDYLVNYPGTDYLVTAPGSSPEHGNVEVMPTIDRTLIYDTFTQVMRCCDILNTDQDFKATVEAARAKLPPYKISQYGQLQEWMFNDYTDGNDSHRHTSHLLGLFPDAQITPDMNPDIAKAAYLSMQRRYAQPDYENTEWTCVNAQGYYARLKDGQKAYDYLKLLANRYNYPNLMSISPKGIALAPYDIFIIDGTLGMGQATSEMLLQSHNDRLEFLPALPSEWSEGEVKGMATRGGFETDFKWKNYKLDYAKITSKAGNKAAIFKNDALDWSNFKVYKVDGNSYEEIATTEQNNTISFDTVAGGNYILSCNLVNDSDPRITYDNMWANPQRAYDDYMHDTHYAYAENASFEMNFTGTGIDLFGETLDGSGAYDIYIDGELKATADQNNKGDRQVQQLLYSIDGLPYGSHKIKGISKDENCVTIDAMRIKTFQGVTINDDNPRITYDSGWNNSDNRGNGDCMDDVHWAYQDGATAEVAFNGTGINYIVEKDPSHGSVDLYLDGVFKENVSLKSQSDRQVQQSVWHISGLTNSPHTLKIVSKNDGYAIIDNFIVSNEGDSYFETGIYSITNMNSNKLLTAEGDTAVQNGNLGDYNQEWLLDDAGDGYFRIRNAYSGKMVTPKDNSTAVGAQAVQGDYINDDNQLWKMVSIDGGYVLIVNKKNGNALQVDAAWTGDGGGISQWSFDAASPNNAPEHFKWKIQDAGNGYKYIINKNANKPMEFDYNSIANNGARCVIYANRLSNAQRWNIEFTSPGVFSIKNVQTGKALSISNGSSDQGASAGMADWTGDAFNNWNIESAMTDGIPCYKLVNKNSDKALFVDGESMDDGATISQWDKTIDMNHGKWILTKMGLPKTAAPIADNLSITGAGNVGNTIKLNYQYNQVEGTAEGASTYNVYTVDDVSSPLGQPAATGTTSSAAGIAYTIQPSDNGKYIVIEVIPKSAAGVTGPSIFSRYIGVLMQPPKALNVSISGDPSYGSTVTAAYTFYDVDGDSDSGTTFKWLRADSASSFDNSTVIGTANTYSIGDQDLGKYIAVEVTPRANNAPYVGAVVRSGIIGPIQAAPGFGKLHVSDIYTQDFTASDILSKIQNNQDGWYHGDSKDGARHEILVNDGGNGKQSMGLHVINDFYNNSWCGIDLTKTGAANADNISGKVAVSFDFMFKIADNYDTSCMQYISLTDGTNKFATLLLEGYDLSLIALNRDKTATAKYNIATGRENISNKWMAATFYIDTDSDTYSVLINNRFVNTDNGKRIPATNNQRPGGANKIDLSKLAAIETGHLWQCWDDTVRIGNIKVGTFTSSVPLNLLNINVTSDYTPDNNRIVAGSTLTANAFLNDSLDSAVYTWEASDNGGDTWYSINNIVPASASKIRVSADCTDVFGYTVSGSKVYNVNKEYNWQITSLSVEGDRLVLGASNHINVKVSNLQGNKTGTIYVGLFAGDKLIDIKMLNNAVPTDGAPIDWNTALNVPSDQRSYKIKAFLWDQNMDVLGPTKQLNMAD